VEQDTHIVARREVVPTGLRQIIGGVGGLFEERVTSAVCTARVLVRHFFSQFRMIVKHFIGEVGSPFRRTAYK
jgi:hypothetical protein